MHVYWASAVNDFHRSLQVIFTCDRRWTEEIVAKEEKQQQQNTSCYANEIFGPHERKKCDHFSMFVLKTSIFLECHTIK